MLPYTVECEDIRADATMTKPANPEKDIIYAPQQVATLVLDELTQRRNQKDLGVRSGIERLDVPLHPLRPGDLVAVIGRPGHYKSGLCQWWARRLAQESQNQEDSRVTVYVTWEMAIEILNHIAQAKRGLALAKDSCMAAQILMDTCGAREIE